MSKKDQYIQLFDKIELEGSYCKHVFVLRTSLKLGKPFTNVTDSRISKPQTVHRNDIRVSQYINIAFSWLYVLVTEVSCFLECPLLTILT